MSTARQTYLDWLRIAAIIGVLFFHSAMPFVAEWEWHIKNAETSNLLMECNFFLSRFRMPLLFFISGAVAYFILQRKTASQFIGIRFKRLFIPLVAGMLLTVPIQVYMERLKGGFSGSYWDFYPTIFTTGPYPTGNFSWHHLWFIAYLFVYDVVLAPVFKACMLHKQRLSFFHWLAKGARIYLLILPSVVGYALLTLRFPQTHDLINDWCGLLYWFFFLLVGFICACFSPLLDSLERKRRLSLAIGFSTIVFINYLRWNQLEPDQVLPNWQTDVRTYLYLSLYAITAWSWVFALIGYGKRYLNKKSPALAYINDAVYPFYILHQTVIVVIAYYVVQTTDTILLKYGFVVLASFLSSMAIYHVFIRPVPFLRFLFGAKPLERKAPTVPEEKPAVKPALPLPV